MIYIYVHMLHFALFYRNMGLGLASASAHIGGVIAPFSSLLVRWSMCFQQLSGNGQTKISNIFFGKKHE